MAEDKLKDPAEKVSGKKEEQQTQDDMSSVDISELTFEDFQAAPAIVARTPHPFEGYPYKKVMIDGREVNATFIIALNPKEIVPQDPSGKGISITTGQGKAKREVKVDIKSSHSRLVIDYEEGGVNRACTFQGEYPLKDGRVFPNCAYVPSHSCRAQIMFKLDPREGRIMLDRRYVLPDPKQLNRLRRIFEMIVNPQLRAERLAKGITGESEESLDDMPEE